MRVKFCGMTRLEDAREAARLGAWAIGLIHHADSPRNVEPGVAAAIGTELRRRVEVVGVFVNPSLDDVAKAVEDESLTMVQLHGDEGPSFCAEVARRTGAKVMRAFQVRSGAEVAGAEAYRVDFHLFDGHHERARGGTGESFDWELLRGRRSTVPMVLSGGLDSANVADAIAVAQPFAVDVASGVEAEPGVKDHGAMAAFFEAAQAASGAEVPS